VLGTTSLADSEHLNILDKFGLAHLRKRGWLLGSWRAYDCEESLMDTFWSESDLDLFALLLIGAVFKNLADLEDPFILS